MSNISKVALIYGFHYVVTELKEKYLRDPKIDILERRRDITELLNIYMIRHKKAINKGSATLKQIKEKLLEIEEHIDPNSQDKNYITSKLPQDILKIQDLLDNSEMSNHPAIDAAGEIVEGLKVLTPPNLMFSKQKKREEKFFMLPPPLNLDFESENEDNKENERCNFLGAFFSRFTNTCM